MDTTDTLYRITIDGTEYTTTDATLTPEQLRRMAQLPATRSLLLLRTGGSLQPLTEGALVNLNGHGIETFISRDTPPAHDQIHYKLQVDHEVYETRSATMTGRDIKALASLPATVALYLKRPGNDQAVADEQVIDFSPAGIEQFTTQAPAPANVHVSVTYTTTARKKEVVAPLTDTLQMVVTKGYEKLGETPRNGDTVLTSAQPRIDLQPHLTDTLHTLLALGLVGGTAPHLTLNIDIEAAAGGA